jgi:hypothetical protein
MPVTLQINAASTGEGVVAGAAAAAALHCNTGAGPEAVVEARGATLLHVTAPYRLLLVLRNCFRLCSHLAVSVWYGSAIVLSSDKLFLRLVCCTIGQ